MKIKSIIASGTFALALLATVPVQAGTVGISSLAGNDSIDWSQLPIGPPGSPIFLSSPQSVVSTGGLSASVSSAGGQFVTLQQSVSWGGSFSPGMSILYTGYGFGSSLGPDITLTFAQPVFAVGAQIETNDFTSYTAQVLSNDGTVYTENGVNNGNGDGSAIFIGLQSTTADISSIQFTLTAVGSGSVNDFAIGTVTLQTTPLPTPLPSTWTMLIAGFVCLGFFAYRGSKKSAAALAAA